METDRVSRVVRALRHRRGLTQEELALRARTSASVISRIECGRLTECSLEAVDAALTALDARLVVDVRWRGGELDRLLDADHASLEEQWHRRLTAWHWLVRDEVSFNEYGDRGRIDLLGWHPGTRTLLVNELKSGIYEMQSLFGTLDVKERLAPVIARRFGWKPERVVVCLVLGEGRTTRRRVVEHAALFSRFDRRGRSAFAWLRRPTEPVGGLLVFLDSSFSRHTGTRRAGRQRVRRRAARSSVESASKSTDARSGPA